MKDWKNTIIIYYKECEEATEKAEREYDNDKRSVRKREIYQWCSAQCEAILELMEKLDIDFEED